MIRRYLKLVGIMFKQNMSKQMIYSGNFWVAFFVDLLLWVFQLVTFTSIFTHVDTINGWTLSHMFVFIGTFNIVDALNMGTYFFGLVEFPSKVRTGALDMMIVKPIDTQFFIAISHLNPGSLLGVVTGGLMVAYGMTTGGFSVTIGKIIGYLVLILMMYILHYALLMLLRVLSFLVVKINSLAEVEDSAIEFAFRVPGVAYKGISRIIFLVILPYGLLASAPTTFITELLSIEQWAAITGITLVFFILTRFLFKKGLKKYTSASS